MDKKIKKIENYKKIIGYFLTIASVLITCFSFGYKVLSEFDKQNELLETTSKLAEKSFIWNKEIPKVERAEVCDAYLASGYDSYTKKLCENIILKDEIFEEDKNEE